MKSGFCFSVFIETFFDIKSHLYFIFSMSSLVESTLTFGCFLSLESCDQSGQPSLSANAKYSASFKSGVISVAWAINPEYSCNGTTSIFDSNISCSTANFNSASLTLSLLENSPRYFDNSSLMNSGVNSFGFLTLNKSFLEVESLSKAATTILASTTRVLGAKENHFPIQASKPCLFAIPLFILSPNSTTSSSVRSLSLVSSSSFLRILSRFTRSSKNCLVSSLQFTPFISEISFLSLSGIAKVKVALPMKKHLQDVCTKYSVFSVNKVFDACRG